MEAVACKPPKAERPGLSTRAFDAEASRILFLSDRINLVKSAAA